MTSRNVTTSDGVIGEVTGIVKGQYGTAITIYIVDDEGTAIDISTYTGTKQVILRSPDAKKTVTLTASFVGTGSTGGLTFTPASGDLNYAGTWVGQVVLPKTSVVDYSAPFEFIVEKRVA